jgi:cell division protein FtsW
MLFSIAFVYSAGSYFALIKGSDPERLLLAHTAKIALAVLCLIIAARIDYHLWSKVSIYLMMISIAALVAVLGVGEQVGGAKRWLNIGMQFQPSELAKFSLILHFGTLISRKQSDLKDFKYGFFPFILWLMLLGLLIALQPNFSMIILIFLIGMILLFVGNARLRHIFATITVGSLAGIVYAISSPYRLNRILFYLGMLEGEANERLSFQVENSLIALGSGGPLGLGIGRSNQNLLLSEPYTDFLFSIIGEEYGFWGLMLITFLFFVILWRCIYIAKRSPDHLGYLYTVGIATSIFIFFIINAFVNTALIPTTGVPLPFLSYGGTSAIFNGILIGIVLNISTQIVANPKGKNPEDEDNPIKSK